MKKHSHQQLEFLCKAIKVINNFPKLSDMLVFFEYKMPFQQLVGKVGNNFLSAVGLGQKKLF
jgi:hypothetical protein